MLWRPSLLICFLLGLCTALVGFQIGQQSGDPPSPLVRCKACDNRLYGSYYNVADYRTTLMINNKSPDLVVVEARVFDLRGEAADLAPFEVPGNDFIETDLGESLRGLPGRFRRGSIELSYFGNFLQVGAQLRLLKERSRLGFEEQLVRSKEFHSSTLRSNWWLPEGNLRMLWILSNASEGTVTAEGTGSGLRNLEQLNGLALRPHETAVFEGVPSGRAGRIELTHDGDPGDLLMRAVVLEPGSGYSSVIESADPAGARTSELHGAGMRLGESVSPVLSLANHSKEASVASVSLTVKVNGSVREIMLADLSLPPGGTRTLERPAFKVALEGAGLQGVDVAGVQVRYSTAPGSVTGYAASVSADRDIAYRVPLLDAKNHFSSAGTYPWDLRGGQNTIFYVKNLTARSQRHHYYLTHGNEVVYFSSFTDLQPGESIAVDVAQLRDQEAIDKHGRLVPPDADKGQIHWSVVGAGVLLDARVEQINLTQGTAATYACAECCNNTIHTELFPSAINGVVNDPPITFFAEQTPEDCEGNMGPTEDVQVSHLWFDDEGIIDVVGEDTVLCVGAGATSLTAFVPVSSGGGESEPECSEEPMGEEVEIEVPVQVAPTVSITGPSSVNVGNPSVQITTAKTPPGGTLSNWRVTSGDQNCVDLTSSGKIKAFASGMVGVKVDYTLNGLTVTSSQFNISLTPVAQFVRIAYTATANTILNTNFTAAEVNQIKDRAEDTMAVLFSQRAGANVVIGNAPAGTPFSTIRVDGNGTGGHCAFDLLNKGRGGLCTIHIGSGSLDVANQSDPVSTTPVNERMNTDRVGDAIARLAAHELGHALGLVAQSTELGGDGLAAKLNVQGLLSGTASHHRTSSGSGVYIMFSTTNVNDERAWNRIIYDFDGNEDTYLDRILP